MRSQLRIAASVAALALACGVSTLALEGGASGQVSVSRSAGAVPQCRSVHLAGVFVRTGAAAGSLGSSIGIVNVGRVACRLGGYPGLEGVRDHHLFHLRINQHGTFAGNLDPTVLAPRVTGGLIIGTGDACNALNNPNRKVAAAVAAAHTYTTLYVELPDHHGTVAIFGGSIDTACGLQVSRLGWVKGFSLRYQ